jgi:hypothetical protein
LPIDWGLIIPDDLWQSNKEAPPLAAGPLPMKRPEALLLLAFWFTTFDNSGIEPLVGLHLVAMTG